MICESTSLNKYINKSSNIFFVFGSEIVLKNNSVDQINSFLKEQNLTEKKIITEADYSKIEKTIIENASGSLFGSKIIIEIGHQKGKIPKEITAGINGIQTGIWSNIVCSLYLYMSKVPYTILHVKKDETKKNKKAPSPFKLFLIFL